MHFMYYILFAVVGFLGGEIINFMIYKLEHEMKFFSKNTCASCSSKMDFVDTFCPIISSITRKRKRKCCGEKVRIISVLNPFICADLSVLSLLVYGNDYLAFSILLALNFIVLIAVCEIDFDQSWIPDRFQIAILILGGLTFIFKAPLTWYERLIGAFAGGFVFLSIYFLSKLILKREGLGFGDVKLVFVSGFFLGWKGMLIALLIGSVVGSIVLLIIKKKQNSDRYREYPFAPFLAIAFIISGLVGNSLVNLYLSIL